MVRFKLCTRGLVIGLLHLPLLLWSSAANADGTTVSIPASSDAEESASGGMSLTSSDLELVRESTDQTVAIRFDEVHIPNRATVTNAYLGFQADEVDTEATSLSIRAEDSDDAPDFTDVDGNISSRKTTTAEVSWGSVPPWTIVGEAGINQQSPNMSAIIQEIVDRPGWIDGNAIVMIISGVGKRVAESHDGDPAGIPLLQIEYLDNEPPVAAIDAPVADLTIVAGESVDFAATGTDPDGNLPLSFHWDFAGGAPTMDVEDPGPVMFEAEGVYSATLTVTDSLGTTGTDRIDILVTTAGGNLPPQVSAGLDQSVDPSEPAYLDGSVLDDGLPKPPGGVTTTWRQISGPGAVSFSDPSAPQTEATFSDNGTYVLELTADDGELFDSDQVTVSASCLGADGPLQVVSGFFSTEKFKPSVEPNKKFDARGASFEYPETISHSMVSLGKGDPDSPNMCWVGGYFTASRSWHDLDISWQTSKQGYDDTEDDRGEMNNTSSATSYHDKMTWTGLHVYNMHDALRTTNTFNNWTIRDVWFDYIRDDCVENDHIHSGTIYDSLFDGCYTGFSVQNSGGEYLGLGQTITMDKVLLRMEPMPYPYKWDVKDDPVVYVDGYGEVPFGHGHIFKMEDGNEPEFRITNSVFLLEYDAENVVFPSAELVTACDNNTMIWLGDPATAPTYLLDEFPGCFTLITDVAEGKAFWKSKVADWHARHPDVGMNRKPAVPGEYVWPRYAGDGTPAPTVSLTADPTSITSGQSATLAWSAANAASCSSPDLPTGGATAGSVSVSPLLTTPYSVTCIGDGGTASDEATVMVTTSEITLDARVFKRRAVRFVELTWSGANGANVDVLRDEQTLVTVPNNGTYTDTLGKKARGDTSAYQICETGTSNCSNTASVSF